jgi:hypothetical protein
MTHTHIPRRSGSGIRQAVAPQKPKRRRFRLPSRINEKCNRVDPERPGIVDDETGQWLCVPVLCTGEPNHRGKHRARLLTGVLHRWQ